MNSAQKAVVSAAKKEGLSPMEIASELMNHDITEVVLGFMRKREVAFNKLSEKEQDGVIAELGSELKKITATACRVINANGVETVAATLKSLKIDGKLTATMVIDGDEPNRHVLTDKAHDKSSILIVLYPNSYSEGMSAHQGEKDQKPLDLEEPDTAKPAKGKAAKRESSPTSAGAIAKKAVEIPPKLMEDAKEFIANQQNCKASALQNHLKIGAAKAIAILEELTAEGVLEFVGDDKAGDYQIVRGAPASAPTAANDSLTFDGVDDEQAPKTLTEELYADIKAKVIADNRVSVGALSVAFDIDTEIVDEAIQRLEADGVVSEESEELGTREVIAQAE